jgi:hypothetical protein
VRNSELLEPSSIYFESTPHLVCFVFLYRVLDVGVEMLNRKYAFGRQRVDIVAKYKEHIYPVELKIKSLDKLTDLMTKYGLEQLWAYRDKAGVKDGWYDMTKASESRGTCTQGRRCGTAFALSFNTFIYRTFFQRRSFVVGFAGLRFCESLLFFCRAGKERLLRKTPFFFLSETLIPAAWEKNMGNRGVNSG